MTLYFICFVTFAHTHRLRETADKNEEIKSLKRQVRLEREAYKEGWTKLKHRIALTKPILTRQARQLEREADRERLESRYIRQVQVFPRPSSPLHVGAFIRITPVSLSLFPSLLSSRSLSLYASLALSLLPPPSLALSALSALFLSLSLYTHRV